MSQPNVIIHDRAAYKAALKLARGTWQRSLITGKETLSLSTLSNRCRNWWGGRYAASRDNLLARLEAAGLGREVRGKHGKRILVFGSPPNGG